MATREFDIVLFGCTGFVGRLVAAHLARHAPDLRIALAGRDGGRVESVRADLPDAARGWPVVVADSDDAASLAAMAARTRVVVSTVGPYAERGLPLVGACAEAGTDYADLTGEALFVRESIDMFDAAAQRSGARIVHSCGFDSVPSDLAVLRAADAARDAGAGAGQLTDTTAHVRMRGGLSGGTFASMKAQVDATKGDEAAQRLVGDAYALSPDRDRAPHADEDEPVLARRGKTWTAPFFMGTFNRQVVHRSNALADLAYGPAFRYREMHDLGQGPAGLARALVAAIGMPAALAGFALPPSRALLDRVLPDPGEGPSEDQRARGMFELVVESVTTSGARVSSRIEADLDPGYDGTAVMLGEAAQTLLDHEGPGGVLTPATALGQAYADRLAAQGFQIDVRVD